MEDVLSYLLRIRDFRQYAGKTILNNVYMDLRGRKPVFKRTRTAIERNNIFATIRVAGEEYPYELVKSRFLKLESSHLEYVIGCMQNTTTKITNIKAYMITSLYNEPTTINHFYQHEVQHDMYGGGWHEKGIV